VELFPRGGKKQKFLPINKPGKESNDYVSKFHPISLLDIGGKVLQKILINRINYHVFSQGFMNENQFGFTPQKGTIDAAMAVKVFVTEGLATGEVIALVSLDVQGAFDVAWWPGILKERRACGCPKNLYELKKSYFTQRTATLSMNSLRLEKEISRGCLQGSCCGACFWNLQFVTELKIYDMNKSGGLCGLFNFGYKRRIGYSSGKLFERRAK